MTDVLIEQGLDDGEIQFSNGDLVLTDGLESAIFLSLSGNEDDAGLDGDKVAHRDWWGNHDETEQAPQYRSRLRDAIDSLPITPANLKRFEEDALSDLAWLTEELAKAVSVTASMPARNTVKISVEVDGTPYSFAFSPRQ